MAASPALLAIAPMRRVMLIDAAGNPVADPAVPATVGPSTVAAVNNVVQIDTVGLGSVGVEFVRPSAGTVVTEGSINGTVWYALPGYSIGNTGNAAPSATLTAAGIYGFDVSEVNFFRVRATVLGAGNTATIIGSRDVIPGLGVFVGGGTLGINSMASLVTGTATIGALISCSWFTETATALAAAATFTGTSRDLGVTSNVVPFTTFGASFFADQAGTAFIEQSTNGTTWRVVATSAVVANTNVDLECKVRNRYYRVRYVNGATINTVMEISSSFRD